MKSEIPTPQRRKWVRLTRLCNNRCLFCLDADACNGTFESVPSIAAVLKKGLAEGCRRVVLSGGEPVIHPDFVRIVALARALGYTHIQTITNGRMFSYGDLLRQAVAAGLSEVTFSLHGACAAQHDRLAGVSGAFAQTIRGIANAVAVRGIVVSSDIVVNRLNVDSLPDIVRLLSRLGVTEYDLLHLMPFGRAWQNWKTLAYAPGRKKHILSRVLRWTEAAGATVWTNRFPASVLEGNERYIQHPAKILDEVSGMQQELRLFLSTGKKMTCGGRRCKFCVLEQFCSDLRQLRTQGFLHGLPAPECLPAPKNSLKRIGAAADIMAIGRFYIKERMTVKAAACRKCAQDRRCRGAGVITVMTKGFAALRPVGRN